MADQRGSGGGPVETIASLVASVALYRSAAKASETSVEAPIRPTSEDPLALADALTVPEPEGGFARRRWRLDQFQRQNNWLAFPIAVMKKFMEDGGSKLAALIAYFGLFSIFPLMLAFTSILGFLLPDREAQERFANAAADQIPVVGSIVRDQTTELDTSLVGFTIGLVVALWSGLRVIDAMQNAMNKVWDIPPINQPNIVKRRLRGLVMLLVLGAGTIGSVVASSIATYLDFIPGAGRVGIWAGTAAVSVILFWVAYQVLTRRRLPWGDLKWGALFGGLSWWGLQTFGTPLIARASVNPTYGDFASIIAMMTFFYLAANMSIIGAELNAVLARHLYPRSITEGDLMESDIRAFELLATSTRCDESYEVRLLPAGAAPPPINDDPELDREEVEPVGKRSSGLGRRLVRRSDEAD